MHEPLYFDELEIGDCWRSPARTVTETDVVNFAGMTGDFDPLHVNHEFASETPFGRPIAHGLLGLSLLAGLSSRSPWVSTAAFSGIQSWDFHRPIYIGDTVHAVTEVAEKQPRGRRCGEVTWQRKLVNQHGEVVQSGVLVTLVALAHTHTHDVIKLAPRSNLAPEEAAADAFERRSRAG